MVKPRDIAGNAEEEEEEEEEEICLFVGRITSQQQRYSKACKVPVVTGIALELMGPVSVYCDWVR